jgi:3-oxoacyl-[acyl-carrier-protein] synthase II
MKVRVVITGIGMVSPLGNSTNACWSSLVAGASGIAGITRFDPSAFSSRIAGELRGFDPLQWMSRKEANKTDPFIQYALAAACMAREDAELQRTPLSPLRTGVLIGSGRGGVTTMEKNMTLLRTRGPRAVSPFYTPMSLVNMASGYVSMKFGSQGPCLDVSTACATGTHALGEAMRIIQRGDADVMFSGGAEAALTPLVLAGFCQARALSLRNTEPEKASRPFDRDRDGFVLAEGAAVLIVEELRHAEKRGARIYAELAGYGLTADAFHYTRPDESGEGSSRAMAQAMTDAGLQPSEIDYINAHGTGTVPNDKIETRAIKKTFAAHAGNIAISSSKSMMGHTLGAAGAIEAAITALTLRNGIITPTSNLEFPDPECDLDYVPKTPRRKNIRNALSNSLGFGGLNAALVFKRYAPE